MLTRLVYASSAHPPLQGDALRSILDVSRRNNAAVGVTGALVYSGGNVLQVLEGPADAVEGVFQRVASDPRHRGVLVLLRERDVERAFPDWAMGYETAETLGGAEGVRSLFDLTLPGSTRAHRMLASFRAVIRAEAV